MISLLHLKLAERYELLSEIGRGGMGIVYRAFDDKLGREVAVKVMLPGLAEDPSFVSRFLREARAAAALSHPNIIIVHDVGQQPVSGWPDDIVYYIVMEYLRGITLTDWLVAHWPLPLADCQPIARQIADALDYAHDRGMIHRDVKPSNIMIDDKGQVKLMDFGLVRMASATQTVQTVVALGTPQYASPEQVLGTELDRRSDIYSFGVVLYQLFAGRVPFDGPTPVAILHSQAYDPPPALQQTRPSLPRAVSDVVLKALAKKPEDRYQSAGELRAALDKAAELSKEGKIVVAPPPGPPELPSTTLVSPVSPGRRRRWLLPALIAGAALLALVAAGLALRSCTPVPPPPTPSASPASATATAVPEHTRTPSATPGLAAPAPPAASDTSTATPTRTASSTPSRTPTETPPATPTWTFTPTPTSTFSPTPTRTLGATATSTSSRTPTRTPTSTPTWTPIPQPDVRVALAQPPDNASGGGEQTFTWSVVTGELAAGQAYELIFWSPGQDPLQDGFGLAEPTTGDQVTVNLDVLDSQPGYPLQGGAWQWGVRVVQTEPYRKLAMAGGPRTLIFVPGGTPAPTASPDTPTAIPSHTAIPTATPVPLPTNTPKPIP